MALSNWDTLALTHDGAASDGSFTSPLGIQVEFYKNWLYIRDPKGWRAGGHYLEPTVAEVTSGRLVYQDVTIEVLRGPQNGVYAVVWSGHKHDGSIRGIVGCGVSGYDGETWTGVLPASLAWWRERLTETERAVLEYDGERHEYDDPVLDVPDVFRKLDWSGAVRFNQGDAYFAARLGGPLPATVPGAADDPMLMRALKRDKP